MGEGFWNGALERRSPVADKAQSAQFLNDSLQHNRFTPPPETRDTSYTKRRSSLDRTQAKLIDTLQLGRTDVVRRSRCTDGGYVLPVISLRPAPHAHNSVRRASGSNNPDARPFHDEARALGDQVHSALGGDRVAPLRQALCVHFEGS